MEQNTKRELYDLGFRFKQAELWNELEDKQVFAVRLPDGSDGYCSVMGMLGLNLCLAMYLGKDGFSGFWKLSQPFKDELYTLFLSLDRQGVFCSYDDKEDVSSEEIKEAQKWARALHKKLTRPYPYLHFERATISRRVEVLTDEQEAQYMKLALQAGLYLSELIEDGEDSYDLVPVVESPNDEVPLLIPDSSAPGGFLMRKTRLPGFSEPERKVPVPLDEFTLARLKKCKPAGTWDMAMVYMITSVIKDQDYGYIPSVPLCYDEGNDNIPPVNAMGDYDKDPDKMFYDFANGLIDIKLRPTAIRVFRWDTRIQAFLQPLVEQLKIKLELADDLPKLESVVLDLIHSSGEADNDMSSMLDMMVQLLDEISVEELRNAPMELQFVARSLVDNMGDQLPERIRKKIRSCMKYWD